MTELGVLQLPQVVSNKKDTIIDVDTDDYLYYQRSHHGDIARTFTIKEAAAYLEVAEITTRRWAKEGKLPFAKVGKNFVFNVDSLREAKKKTAPTKA